MEHYKKILAFVKPYTSVVLVSLFFSFLYVIMNTSSLWMVSSLISNILDPNVLSSSNSNGIIQQLESYTLYIIGEGNQFEQLQMLCLLLFITFLLKNIFLYISEVAMAYVNNKMIMDIRTNIFEHLQFLPMSFFNKNKTGEISSIVLNDGARMRIAVTKAARKLSKDPLNIIFMLTMLFLINVKMTLIALIMAPLVSLVVFKVGQSIRRKVTRSSKSIAGITNIINENILGIQVVKSFIKEHQQIEKFISESKRYFHLMLKKDKLSFITTPLNDMIGVSIAVILLWVGGNEVFYNSSMDPDDFIKFIIFLFAIMEPAKSLASVNLAIQTSLASAARVFKILNINPQNEDKSSITVGSFNESIKINNLNFNYSENENKILKNISFDISKGDTTAIVGKSGSGKSTLINLLPRFYDISKGTIEIDGVDIKRISLQSLRKLISLVPQDSFLFNDTIENNIRLGKESATKDEIINAAKGANALEFIDNLPEKFNSKIGERGLKLSGGQRQRISIARAILKNSPILILDEATASLDSDSEIKVHKAIDNLIKNKTVIIIAHRLSTIMNADKIIVLKDGELIESGKHDELIKIDKEYKFLYDAQFKK